jgi:hypothetical protein
VRNKIYIKIKTEVYSSIKSIWIKFIKLKKNLIFGNPILKIIIIKKLKQGMDYLKNEYIKKKCINFKLLNIKSIIKRLLDKNKKLAFDKLYGYLL